MSKRDRSEWTVGQIEELDSEIARLQQRRDALASMPEDIYEEGTVIVFAQRVMLANRPGYARAERIDQIVAVKGETPRWGVRWCVSGTSLARYATWETLMDLAADAVDGVWVVSEWEALA